MRDYKEKMEACRLPEDRYRELRRYCLAHKDSPLISQVAYDAIGDELARYVIRHVTSRDYNMAKMEVDGLPCNRDTFRVYRARFFCELDKRI